MSGLIERQHYTFGNDEFNLEAAYHDCKLVFDGITDDDSFQKADTGLILYYANEIIYALREALTGTERNGGRDMRLIDADSLKKKIMGEPPETRYPSWYAAMVDAEPDASIVGLKTIDAMVQAAYKAGKEGKPLMVALNEEVTT